MSLERAPETHAWQWEVSSALPPDWWSWRESQSLFSSREWLDAMAHRFEGEHRWFLGRSGGRPEVGAFGTVVRRPEDASASRDFPRLLLESPRDLEVGPGALEGLREVRAAAPPRAEWFPAAVVTYPGSEAFPAGPSASSATAVEGLCATILDAAADAGCSSVGVLYVPRRESLFAAALGRLGFVPFPLASATSLTLPGTSFDDYLGSLPPARRREVARTRRRIREAGVSIALEPIETCVDELVELWCNHKRKYGRPVDEATERHTFDVLAQRFADATTVFVARAEERVVSFASMVWDGRVWHGFLNGADYDDPRAKNTYFELGYYSPIEAAYEVGRRELSFGYGVTDAKRRRGCRVDTVYGWVASPDAGIVEAAGAAARVLSAATGAR